MRPRVETIDTSRDEKIKWAIRASMSGWLEAVSIAWKLNSSEGAILPRLRQLVADGTLQTRKVRNHIEYTIAPTGAWGSWSISRSV